MIKDIVLRIVFGLTLCGVQGSDMMISLDWFDLICPSFELCIVTSEADSAVL